MAKAKIGLLFLNRDLRQKRNSVLRKRTCFREMGNMHCTIAAYKHALIVFYF